ncbi:MAG: hypothetical protein ABIP02_04670 [Arenimonas sp.]
MARKVKGVTRHEVVEKSTAGWMMRIQRQGVLTQEYFSDGVHGSKNKARIAAEARYQQLAKKLPPPTLAGSVKSVRNSSGKVGVRLAVNKGRLEDSNSLSSYVAFWREDGADYTIQFGCLKYGKRGAFQRASIARDKKTCDRELIEKAFKLIKK